MLPVFNILIKSCRAFSLAVLGSCISTCIYDENTGIGGMNHFLIPGDFRDEEIFLSEIPKNAKKKAIAAGVVAGTGAAAGTVTYQMQDDFNAEGVTNLFQGTLDFNDNNVTFSGDFVVGNTAATAIASGTGTVTASGYVNFTGLDTFNHENGTWKFTKTSGTQQITSNGATFGYVVFDGAPSTSVTYQMQDAFSARKTVTLNQGTLDFNDQNATLYGDFSVGTTANTKILSGTGTITFDYTDGDVTVNFANLDDLQGENGTWKFDATNNDFNKFNIRGLNSNLNFSNVTLYGGGPNVPSNVRFDFSDASNDMGSTGTLGDVVAGKLAGRTSDDEITVFDPMGLAVPDVASALVVYEKAKSRGVGS